MTGWAANPAVWQAFAPWLLLTTVVLAACDSSVSLQDKVFQCTSASDCDNVTVFCLDDPASPTKKACHPKGWTVADATGAVDSQGLDGPDDSDGAPDAIADSLDATDASDVDATDVPDISCTDVGCPCGGEGSCGKGLACLAKGGGTPTCVDLATTLCMPCGKDADCAGGDLGLGATCLGYGPAGSFCGAECSSGECPEGFTCETQPGGGKQCRATAGSCEGHCPAYAKNHPNSTVCSSGPCKGSRECQDGSLTACSAPTAVTEIACNQTDDDCDGKTDEWPSATCKVPGKTGSSSGTPCATDGDCSKAGETCIEGGCGVLVGACEGGTWSCVGAAAKCVGAGPVPEACNGKDDDCNGKIDDGFFYDDPSGGTKYTGDACGAGVCVGGKVVCKNDAATCSTASKAGVETCNGLDDDCDGKTDETFTDLGQPCDGTDKDQCKNGKWTCDATQGGVVCASETVTDLAETCNGTDDDCDGAIDEDFPLGAACDGPDSDKCANGLKVCDGQGGVTCGSETKTDLTEVCNGLDDDCNGSADDGLGVGAACDGPDSDLCSNGIQVCDGKGGVTCGAESKVDLVEMCNDVDDDCDGKTDEGCVDADKDGYCAPGINVVPGNAICAKGGGDCNDTDAAVNLGASEACNGVDDDCDGGTDNAVKNTSGPLTQACYMGPSVNKGVGACVTGVQTCSGGTYGACIGSVLPASSDTCGNGKDDNCNGSADEGCDTPVAISSGSYAIGCPNGSACGTGESPQFPYPVQDFSIEPYEVSVGQFAACVSAGPCSAPKTGTGCNWGVSGKESHPVNCVTWAQARAYCQAEGGDLPTELQWEAVVDGGPCAALGQNPGPSCAPKDGNSAVFPWGSSAPSCKTTDANFANVASCSLGGTVPVSGPLQGAYKVAHMAGNVAEWTLSTFANYPFQPQSTPATGGPTISVRGGSYASTDNASRRFSREKDDVSVALPTIGFRCVFAGPGGP